MTQLNDIYRLRDQFRGSDPAARKAREICDLAAQKIMAEQPDPPGLVRRTAQRIRQALGPAAPRKVRRYD